jgi:hypothetical protein
MSTFPTAFWKKQPAGEAEAFSVSWETGLAWSRGDGVGELNVNTPIQSQTTFPFLVEDEEYYSSYTTDIWAGDPATIPYYAWYLTGGFDNAGENNLSAYHQANPWTLHSTGIRIDFEADYDTAHVIGATIAGSRSIEAGYNSFVQSGSATGTFTVSVAQAPATLLVEASGLGEDFDYAGGAPSYDAMTVYLDDTLICSGKFPGDDRNVLALSANYDMQQVKLYSGADLETITNTTDSPKGEPRADSSELVDQNIRTSYTTSNGVGTFTGTNLAAGTHEIKINVSTIDGIYNSGAFYGLDFNLT